MGSSALIELPDSNVRRIRPSTSASSLARDSLMLSVSVEFSASLYRHSPRRDLCGSLRMGVRHGVGMDRCGERSEIIWPVVTDAIDQEGWGTIHAAAHAT